MNRAEELFERVIAGGEAVIDQMIADRQSEELFLDFKRSADGGMGTKLHHNDRNNLSKAISGFGNSEGGVIIWGVDCRDIAGTGDVARAKFPLEDPVKFVSWLHGAISGCTLPPHSGVQHSAIQVGGGKGFAVTLIPRSFIAPHQTVGTLQYYMRAGSDFVPVPHGVLQGMFGRPPQPHVFHMWAVGPVQIQPVVGSPKAVKFDIGVMLTNRGPGIARDLFLNVNVWSPNGPSQVSYSFQNPSDWQGGLILGNRAQIISKDHVKVAPEAILTPLVVSLHLQPPFESALTIEISYGHGGSPTTKIHRSTEPAQIYAGFTTTILQRNEEGARSFLESLFQ